jgi:hypothetical protein
MAGQDTGPEQWWPRVAGIQCLYMHSRVRRYVVERQKVPVGSADSVAVDDQAGGGSAPGGQRQVPTARIDQQQPRELAATVWQCVSSKGRLDGATSGAWAR